jgi:dTDP-4-amino-4,6-dideoxygalactose transaminase
MMFEDKIHVGRPCIGNREEFLARVSDILDRRWLSNSGRYVLEFEKRVADFVGVKHCISMCNATAALEISARALGLSGEVIVPSFTFVATAHALQWQGITPVFADINPETHNIDARKIECLITPKTTGIIGVHVWGRGCQTDQIEELGKKHGLRVMYDASHAFGCSLKGKMIGGFGECEVFSFHATKFINTLEGGCVVTDNDELAYQIRMMTNFGFVDYDRVDYLGINGKMNEVSAAMGLTNLDSIREIVDNNRKNYEAYRSGLQGLEGLSLINYDTREICNYQYVVLTIDPDKCPVSRDEIVRELHANNVLARKYFWPGCHRMEPYKSLQPNASLLLPETERLSSQIIVLPTGQTIDVDVVEKITSIMRKFID